jgi:hypothetical protein
LPFSLAFSDQLCGVLGFEREERASRDKETVVEIALHNVIVGALAVEERRARIDL